MPRWPSGPKRDCYARGLEFNFQVEQKVLLGFSIKFSVAARSWDLWPVNGNRLAPYYNGPKHTGELWVYIGTPLPNPPGNTGVCFLNIDHELDEIFLEMLAARYQHHILKLATNKCCYFSLPQSWV